MASKWRNGAGTPLLSGAEQHHMDLLESDDVSKSLD
jgi:hypothetical protein